MPEPEVADALIRVAAGDRPGALDLLSELGSRNAPSRLVRSLHTYLSGTGAESVYHDPGAFTAFIDGAGNVALYERTAAAVAAIHAAVAPGTVADIGCGDGRLTAAVLDAATTSIDLVEPSVGLLDIALERLGSRASIARPHQMTVSGFLEAIPGRRWDLVQSTFAIHNLCRSEREPVLTELATRTSRLVLAEFDIPRFEDRSLAHARYAADRYERGLAEYAGSEPVAQGFLMPVLVGQFDPSQPRLTFEQPADEWVAELRAAGFGTVEVIPVIDYWWAPATVIDARP